MTAPVSQVLSEAAWKQFAADFREMTDQEIEAESDSCRDQIAEAEEWLEAVASWEAAGKPRRAAALAKEQGK